MDRVRITSLVDTSVAIEDIGERLDGKGSHAVVLKATADASERLHALRGAGWVRVDPIPAPVRFWPFSSPERPPATVRVPGPPQTDQAVLSEIAAVRADVARLTALLTSGLVPGSASAAPSVAGPAGSGNPVFIPSRIVPDVKADVKVQEGEVAKDIEAGAAALRQLRRGK